MGKRKKWSVASVVDLDFVGRTKRVKFHFSHTDVNNDIWLEAQSDRIAPLHTYTNRPLPRQRKNISKDEQRPKTDTKEKSKQRSLDDNASVDSSVAMEASENGRAVFEDENDDEQIGVGAVEGYEEIGDADTEESEVEEMELVGSDANEEEATDEDAVDDGLDDEIEDDESEDSADLEKNFVKNEDLVVATVTDHSSPDGSPKRDHLDNAPLDPEKTLGLSEPSTIPKKKSVLPQSDPPAGNQTRIPKKKKTKLDDAPRTILGALGPRAKANYESPSLSSYPKNPSARSSALQLSSPTASHVSEQKSQFALDSCRDTKVNRDLFSGSCEHRRCKDKSTMVGLLSRRAEEFRKRAIDRRNELKFNRDVIHKKTSMNEGPYRPEDLSLRFRSGRSRETDSEMHMQRADFNIPRRSAPSDQRLEETLVGGSVSSRDPYGYQGHDVGMQSHFDGHDTEDYRRRRLDYDRPNGDNETHDVGMQSQFDGHDAEEYRRRRFDYERLNDGGSFEHNSYSDRHDVSDYDPDPRGMDSIPRNQARSNDYASNDIDGTYSRYNNRTDDIDAERYPRDEDYRNEYPRRLTDHHRNLHEKDWFEMHTHSNRGRMEEEDRNTSKRGYDADPIEASPRKRGYSPSKRDNLLDDTTSHKDYPVEEMQKQYFSSRRNGDCDRWIDDDRWSHDKFLQDDQRYEDFRAKPDSRAYPRSDDDYKNQWDDERHRDEDIRRGDSDDRRREYVHRRDDYRYESPPRCRRRDHRGRDEYAFRAQEHARRRDRYYYDRYRR
jgi:hypothetical protein